eukprot:COSAG05_NODE_3302_length_2164_cov_998.690676_1_plen_91_part_10
MYRKVVDRRCIIRRTTDDLVEHTLGGSGAYQPAHHHHSAHEAMYFDRRRSDISLGTKIAYMRHRLQGIVVYVTVSMHIPLDLDELPHEDQY